MSFDLGVWHERAGITSAQASARYDQLLGAVNPVTPDEAHPQVEAFHRDLTARWPNLDDVPDDDVDSSPWSAGITVLREGVVLTIAWSRAEEVAAVVLGLADKHGLVAYDPQGGTVQHPQVLRAAPGLALSTSDGSLHGDPDVATVERVVRALASDDWFAVLERGDRYVQVGLGEDAGTRAGWYALEHRDGSPERHFRVELDDVDAVVGAFTGFARGDDAWVDRHTWERVEF